MLFLPVKGSVLMVVKWSPAVISASESSTRRSILVHPGSRGSVPVVEGAVPAPTPVETPSGTPERRRPSATPVVIEVVPSTSAAKSTASAATPGSLSWVKYGQFC